MLTIHAFSGGETYASRHLSANDYYAEGERIRGQWMGRGADLLELNGEVTLDQFDAVRPGLHPATGEFLRHRQNVGRFDKNGERLSSARSLYDFTSRLPSRFRCNRWWIPGLRDAHTQALAEMASGMELLAGHGFANKAACTKTTAPAIW
jgi:hypothetical protein